LGSGVILLAIVAMWAIVLVPTLLRRHDNVTESRSVDRFATAMRILSRRTPEIPAREIVMPPRPAAARAAVVSPAVDAPPSRWRITRIVADSRPDLGALTGRRPAAVSGGSPARYADGDRSPGRGRLASSGRASLAVRRRRLLLGLVVSFVVSLLIAAVAGGAAWGLTVCLAVVCVGYLAHLRIETRRAADLARRRRAAAARAADPADGRTGWATVGAGSADSSSDADDGRWDPVDVPLPTYVTKPPAPPRTTEVEPVGVWVDGLLEEAAESGADAPPAEDLDGIIDRRAVGD
jgi:hypothetical protein